MSELIKGSISVETFEEASLDEFSSVVVTFSFNSNYVVNTVDEVSVAEFVSNKISFARNLCLKLRESKTKNLYLIINYESDNIVNKMMAKIVRDIFEKEKDSISINVIETHMELMANSNYAQRRFGYTEGFTAPNIDKITKICTVIDTQTVNQHCGIVYSTSI